MPKDVNFWIVVIAAILLLGALAIWRWGKNIKLKVGGVAVETSDRDGAREASDPVKVGEKAVVDGHVGEVIGRSGVTPAMQHGPTDVGNQLKVGKDGSVDRIVGVEIGQPKK
jgi:hypothetical protein